MASNESSIEFPGIESPMTASMTVSRGVTPGVGLVRMLPQDGLSLGPGTLRFEHDGRVLELPDCLPVVSRLRQVRSGRSDKGPRWHWQIQVLDHRWRWEGGSITGDYNRRLGDGTVDPSTRKSPAELAQILLLAMGEGNADTSRMPGGVWPRAKWTGGSPALYLAELCEQVACEVCGGEVARVVIWPRGQGPELPAGGDRMSPLASYRTPARPSAIVLVGGATVYQSALSLDAQTQERDGDIRPKDNASYKPDDGWGSVSPFSVSNVTDEDDRPVAVESLWRWFRVFAQAHGGLAVPGCPALVTSVTQYVLRGQLVEWAQAADGSALALRAFLSGEFWCYADDAINLEEETRYVGPWTLQPDRHLVVLPLPLFSLSESSGDTHDRTLLHPSLFLTTSYHVRGADGDLVTFTRAQALGGGGGPLVLHRPEIFDSVRATYDDQGNLSGLVTTAAQATAEAQAYLTIFAASWADDETDDVQYVGFPDVELTGRVAQIKYEAGVGRPASTRVGLGVEFDMLSTPRSELRRREQLAAVVQEVR